MAKRPNLVIVDTTTGEFHDIAPRKQRVHKYIRWHSVNANRAYDAIRRIYPRRASLYLFGILPCVMEAGNWIPDPQRHVHRELRIPPRTIAAGLASLVRLGIIQRFGSAYRFNPHIAWNGYLKDLQRAMITWDQYVPRDPIGLQRNHAQA